MQVNRVVIKLSAGLLVKGQVIQSQWLEDLGYLIADLQKTNHDIWLVTSGAVALTKQKVKGTIDKYDAAKGQQELFDLYKQAFSKSGLKVAEVLIAKEDFERRKSYLKIRDNFNNLAKAQTIALINDRHYLDNLAKYQFNDNDETAGLVASLVDAERLVLASTVNGVLRPDGTTLKEVAFGDKSWTLYVTKKTSEHGKGGMLFKCFAAEHSAQRGVEAIICDGSSIENIRRAVDGERIGTTFVADRRIVARKRWILDKRDFSTGEIQVDDGLAKIIEQGKIVSLLTVGIASVKGKFVENDIVTIKHGAKTLGYGEVNLDAKTAHRAISEKTSRLLVHYDKYARIKG